MLRPGSQKGVHTLGNPGSFWIEYESRIEEKPLASHQAGEEMTGCDKNRHHCDENWLAEVTFLQPRMREEE
jgi:hypothetical protein